MGSLPAFCQEYIYPNKLLSDQGLIEYRRYSLEEARAIEIGDNNVTPHNPFLLDWGPEKRIADVADPYAPKLATLGDSIYCTFTTVGPIQPYFIRSLDAGISWEPYIPLADTLVHRFYLFPEIVYNNGRLLIGCATQIIQGNNLSFFKSTNSGASWGTINQVFPYPNNNISNYSSICNVGSRIYWSYINYHDYDSIYVLTSTSWGQSWNGRGANVAYLNGTPQNMCLRASGNNVYLAWVSEAQGVGIRYSRSTNGGVSWSPDLDLAQDSLGSQEPYISVDGSNVIISWMGYKYSPPGFTGDLFIRKSFDSGNSWDSSQVLTSSHKVWSGKTFVKDSLIIATWDDLRFGSNNSEAMAKVSIDLGQSWADEVRMSYGEGDSYNPISTTTGNIIHVLWGDGRSEAPGLYYRMYDPNYDAVEENPQIPEKAAILTAYPNPFNSSVIISYFNDKENTRELNIYNLLGEKIRTIRIEGKGGQAVWDGKDDNHNPVSSGVYFAKISASGKDISVKLVLLK